MTGPIKHSIHQSEEPGEFPSLDGSKRSARSDFTDVVIAAARRELDIMGTPKSDTSSPGSMEALLAEQGYVTPDNQKLESDNSPAPSESGSVASGRSDDSPKIPEDIEIAMRRKNMERFMKRIALKHKAMSPETRSLRLDEAHNRHGRRGSIMDVLDPGGKSKQGSRGKIRRKSCIDMSKEVTQKEKKPQAQKQTKGWELDGKTPNRRASISVFKPLS